MAGPLQVAYLSGPELAKRPSAWREGVLGGVLYVASDEMKAACDGMTAGDMPLIAVDIPPLDGQNSVAEIWHVGGTVRTGLTGALRYRHDDTLLFGTIHAVPYEGDAAPGASLQDASETAYRAIFRLLADLDYPFVLRFWNYFAGINRVTDGMERYRQFNIGRQEAFLASGRSVSDKVPAACALGAQSGGLAIAFLASRIVPQSLENPRQVSAYHYPHEYGPRSPTFSRACLAGLGGGEALFISGTASIVGHKSLHPGDARAQTRESMANIAAVLDVANRQCGGRFNLAALVYKVYIRQAADYTSVREEFERIVGPGAQAVYLQADICRAELLVEIEASGGHSIDFAPLTAGR